MITGQQMRSPQRAKFSFSKRNSSQVRGATINNVMFPNVNSGMMNMASQTTHFSVQVPSRQSNNNQSFTTAPPRTAPDYNLKMRSHSIDANSHLNTRMMLKEKLKIQKLKEQQSES